MTNLLESGVEWLRDTLKSSAATSITITRSPTTSPSRTAVVGSTRMEVVTEEGDALQAKVRDYLIDVDEYDLGAGNVEPAEGDEIRETVGSATHVFTVVPLDGDRAWRYSDPYHKTYRVHTKHTKTE